jgi:hypothetical protein
MQRINEMMKDAVSPAFEVLKNSALTESQLNAAMTTTELVAAKAREIDKAMAPLKDLRLPAIFKTPVATYQLDPRSGVFEQPVRLMEPVMVELPDPPSWWNQHWIGLAGLLVALASLVVAIIALV